MNYRGITSTTVRTSTRLRHLRIPEKPYQNIFSQSLMQLGLYRTHALEGRNENKIEVKFVVDKK